MDNKNLLLFAAIGLGAFAFWNMRQGQEQRFFVPGVGWVPESLLPMYGYREMNGQWYSESQIDSAIIQAGGDPGTTYNEGTAIFNDIMNILNSLAPLVTTIITVVTDANKDKAITQIIAKYTDPQSPDYIPMFPYTAAQLQSFTVAQLQQLLDTGSISGIFSCALAAKELPSGSSWAGRTLAFCRHKRNKR